MRDTGQNKLFFGYYLVGAAFLAQFVAIGIYSYVLGSFMMPMIQELGWTRAEFSLTRTIGQLVMAFVGVFVGVRGGPVRRSSDHVMGGQPYCV